jgi:RNA polymerase sigma-70 factor (ECF subfamily)
LERNELFNDWIDEFKPLLFKIINVYGKESYDKEDLFQEISIQIWKSIPNFKNNCSVHTWIYRIALNTAIKWKTRSKNRDSDLEKQETVLEINEEPSSNLTWLYNEISMLDSIEKSITLLMLDGFSYIEISEITGMSINHVGVKINRIKKYLKERSKLL